MKSSAKKVQEFLQSRGHDFVVQELPASTRTAQNAAEAIGCEVAQIAKSLVFRDADSGEPVLVVASGANRVDLEKIKTALGISLVKSDAAFVKERLGYAIGGVPPVAHQSRVITLLDEDLKHYPTLWAAAGTPNAVFELGWEDLQTLTEGRWVRLAE